MGIDGRVLIVDDERDLAESCAFFLRRAGHAAEVAFSGDEAMKALEQRRFALVVTDLRMPRMSGLALLDEIKSRDPDVEVVMITGHPGVDTAVEAIRRGALDYITKPFDEEQLMARVEKALAHRQLKEHNLGFKERMRRGTAGRRLIHRSAVFARTVETIERAARTDASVLIQGESGTGKELLAHHLHDSSARSTRSFVPVDCASLPESLAESELFGHVKGAFSGAIDHKMGLFEVADGGTLFLDEIGELAPALQTKLLRAIQERQFRRVGATDTRSVDVRIVCATNRTLAAEVEAGRFRQDLFYRLDVIRIDVPPLRERREDVELLASYFLERFRDQNPACVAAGFSEDALARLTAFDWPGNVRQLRNVVERAATLGHAAQIEPGDLPDELLGAGPATEPGDLEGSFQEMKARKVAAIESSYLIALLRRHRGNVTRSAEDAGMTRSAFQKLMQRYGIKSQVFRD